MQVTPVCLAGGDGADAGFRFRGGGAFSRGGWGRSGHVAGGAFLVGELLLGLGGGGFVGHSGCVGRAVGWVERKR